MHIDWWTLAFQVVNFLAVVWLLSRLLFRPIRRVIEQREEADRKAAEAAQAKSDAAAAIRTDYEARIAGIAEQKRKEEAELHAQMAAERDALLKKARDEAEALLTQARAQIEAERDQAVDQLSGEIGELATRMTQKALGAPDILTPGAALARAEAHIEALAPGDLDELRADLAGARGALTVASAAGLSEAEQAAWTGMLHRRFGDGIAIVFAVDAALIGGAELRFPHADLSFSVAARLREAVNELKG